MAMFLEPTFPLELSYGSTATSMFSTRIIGAETGWESRNINWESSRNKFDTAMLVQTQQNLDDLNEFFHAMHGSGYPFKFLDWGDYKSRGVSQPISFDDQIIAVSEGQTEIPITKTYTDKSGTYNSVRNITQPYPSSVRVGRGPDISNLTEIFVGADFNIVDGKIILNVALLAGEVISAGFQFYLPMRFESDEFSTNLSAYHVGDAHVPVIEIRIKSE